MIGRAARQPPLEIALESSLYYHSELGLNSRLDELHAANSSGGIPAESQQLDRPSATDSACLPTRYSTSGNPTAVGRSGCGRGVAPLPGFGQRRNTGCLARIPSSEGNPNRNPLSADSPGVAGLKGVLQSTETPTSISFASSRPDKRICRASRAGVLWRSL